MRNLCRLVVLAVAMSGSLALHAAGIKDDIRIMRAWARATAPGQDQAAVYLTIASKRAATLVALSTPLAKTCQFHVMTTDNGMMRMREVSQIEIPAGSPVDLEKSGYHAMLIGLKSQLREGGILPFVLTVKVGKQTVNVAASAEVKSLTASDEAMPMDNDEHQQMQMQMQMQMR
jgi:copper(I)-binding protein